MPGLIGGFNLSKIYFLKSGLSANRDSNPARQAIAMPKNQPRKQKKQLNAMSEIILTTKEELARFIEQCFEKNISRAIAEHAASDKNESEFVDKKEAAKLVGCSTATLDKFRREGRLTLHKFGKKAVRFKRAEVLALLKTPKR